MLRLRKLLELRRKDLAKGLETRRPATGGEDPYGVTDRDRDGSRPNQFGVGGIPWFKATTRPLNNPSLQHFQFRVPSWSRHSCYNLELHSVTKYSEDFPPTTPTTRGPHRDREALTIRGHLKATSKKPAHDAKRAARKAHDAICVKTYIRPDTLVDPRQSTFVRNQAFVRSMVLVFGTTGYQL